MPRQYKRKLGARRYADYDPATLEEALQKVAEDGWSLRRASVEFQIPFGTLRNKFNGLRNRKTGGQKVFSENEEKAFISHASLCGEWGFPLTILDIRNLAKNYLDSKGRTITRFKENMPGKDWVYGLLERHKNEISQKLATNIKKCRANVSRETIVEYFENLRETLNDVPACNVFNYDETNLQDDPGKKKMLFRRGTKYPERVCNFTKTAITVMMCGSASGVLLPPYVIYKAERLWQQWVELGPKGDPCCNERCCSSGSRYNRTHHGWMDSQTFTEWFESCFLPHAKRLPGRKVLLGDNLSSHFTDIVLTQCQENDIAFVCLPKNSTHLTQPLDVGFFRPFKNAWRKVLTNWKATHKQQTSIDKKDFPHLLASTLAEMENTSDNAIKNDLISSFQATGIIPIDPERVLRKIPADDNDPRADVSETLLNYLQQQRFSAAPTRRNIKRQKLTVEPGRSVTANNDSSSESDVNEPVTNDNSDDEPLEEDVQEAVRHESEYFEPRIEDIEVGKFVLVKVLGGSRKKTVYRYTAVVQGMNSVEGIQEIEVLGLKSCDKSRKLFAPQPNDEFVADLEDVIAILPTPSVTNLNDKVTYSFEKEIDVFEM